MTNTSFFTLHDYAVIVCTGADHLDFLHHQLSQSVLDLPMGENAAARFFCYCTAKGRVVANGMIWRLDNACYLLVHQTMADILVKKLRMYVLRKKVTMQILGCTIQANLSSSLPHLAMKSIQQNTIQTLKIGYSGAEFCIQWDIDEKHPHIDAETVASCAWQQHIMRHGPIWVSERSTERYTPHALNLDQIGAINFKKGCYPGQEIVARTHYLGHIKKRLQALCLSTALPQDILNIPVESLIIYNMQQQDVGEIVDIFIATHHQDTQILAWAYLPHDFQWFENNLQFKAPYGDIKILPFDE